MRELLFDYSLASEFISDSEIEEMRTRAEKAKETLLSRSGEGNGFLGWIDQPIKFDNKEFECIRETAKEIWSKCDVFVVIGIGGSYLGARAAIEFLNHTFYNSLPKDKRKTPEIYYAGHNMSETYLHHLIEIIKDKEICINVISKSGTTTEPAISFRVLRKLMEEKYGKEEAARRIYATTDKHKGALKSLADKEGYKTFVVPDDIGGRFSVLSAVGLLPIAVSGANIEEIMLGAAEMREQCLYNSYHQNSAMMYAVTRNILYNKGKVIEVLANYEPAFHYIAEWWKQLYAESEGKDGKGLFPAAMDFTTDLHSQGQFVQQGPRIMFETVIEMLNNTSDIIIEEEEGDIDGLNYIGGEALDFINKNAMKGSQLAHTDGGVPNLVIKVPDRTERSLGRLFYFFMFACGVSGYMIGVNPFNQPGVENYKTNMFALLGKPGYEKQRGELIERLLK